MFAQPRLIAVFGVGKDEFISKLVGRNVNLRRGPRYGKSSGRHRIPCPTDDRFLPIETNSVIHADFSFEGQETILVGMPERNYVYTEPSDTNMLKVIAGFLKESYEHNVLLSGIIYLHLITFIPEDPFLRSFTMFPGLCGENAFKNIILATSQWEWNCVEEKCGINRVELEQELSSNLWSKMIAGGSRVRQNWGDHNTAEQMIRELVQHTPVALDIQHELVDENKRLVDTAAGSYVHEGLKQLHQRYQKELNECYEILQTSKTITRSL
jgi:hypothetical protein